MTTGNGGVGATLHAFFAEHLIVHKRVSPQTIASYRDTFRLLLEFARNKIGKEPSALQITDLDAPMILTFLNHLEKERKNSPRSRNARLAAIRSFFRLVALREPSHVDIATRVLSIPLKRTDHRLVGYLTRPEIDAILAAPNRTRWQGRRDHALLLTLYNAGARVSEIKGVKWPQIRVGTTTSLHLEGKGRKERVVPLWKSTAKVLAAWRREADGATRIAFPNARGAELSRDGVDHILKRAVAAAAPACPSLLAKRISPHVIRHTTAMHLLQSGVDMATIALWLGHESLETTHCYVEADLALKEQALEKLAPAGLKPGRYKPNDAVLAFLASL